VQSVRIVRVPRRKVDVTFPWTTACSPNTITFPGAETMKAGIIGDEALRPCGGRTLGLPPLASPLICTRLTPSPKSSTLAGISEVVGDNDGVLEVGVVMM
jgi:hypothetical protein